MFAQPFNPSPVHAWLHDHVSVLSTIDPDEPLDDLEPLRDLVGDARVVAIGESAHFLREFWLIRQRVLRFLHERCGFTVFALEFGFAEGFALASWVMGSGSEEALSSVSPAAANWGAGDAMRWLRRYNASRL